MSEEQDKYEQELNQPVRQFRDKAVSEEDKFKPVDRTDQIKKNPSKVQVVKQPQALTDEQKEKIDANSLLQALVANKASDLHISANSPIKIRINGRLKSLIVNGAPLVLGPEDTQRILLDIAKERQQAIFDEKHELDFAYSIPGLARFRVNLFYSKGAISGVFRIIPHEILSLEQLNMPLVLKELANSPRGLVLVTGPTGSGKALTLDTTIPTLTGYVTMENIKVGDKVFSREGEVCTVTNVFDINQTPDLYRMHLSDGQTIDCDWDHQWLVATDWSRNRIRHNKNQKVSSRFDELQNRADQLNNLAQHYDTQQWSSLKDLLEIVKQHDLHGTNDKALANGAYRSETSIYEALRYTECSHSLTTRKVKILAGNMRQEHHREMPSHQYPTKEALNCLALRLRQMSVKPKDQVEYVKMTTGEILQNGIQKPESNRNQFAIPVGKALELPTATLPVHPYVLGAWLGDGSVKTATLTQSNIKLQNQDKSDQEYLLEELNKCGYEAYVQNKTKTRISVRNLTVGLKETKVYDNKHIPIQYLRASKQQRLELLQGLMDTDGTISPNGNCELTLCNQTLAKQSLELIRSLGIKATIKESKAGYTITNEKGQKERIETRNRWRICFTTTQQIFRLPRKAQRLPTKQRETQNWLYITKIEQIQSRPARCITVDSEDHTYLCGEGSLVTSNSTTLAAMVDYINRNREQHILTIEDPIEFVHDSKKSLVSQRELHSDTYSFANALRAALREDPDVILVGEMRDPETIELGITAAETGHLVFATLHTQDASQTIDRLVDSFPEGQQNQVRSQLSLALRGVVSQQLIRTQDGKGRVAGLEILINNTGIANALRTGKTEQIYSQIQTGAKYGMQTMDSSLADLISEGKISKQIASAISSNPGELDKMLTGRIKTETAAAAAQKRQ